MHPFNYGVVRNCKTVLIEMLLVQRLGGPMISASHFQLEGQWVASKSNVIIDVVSEYDKKLNSTLSLSNGV